MIWDGKHMWIWNISNTNNGDVFAIIDQAKRLGLSGIIVKYHEGNQPYGNGGESRFQDDFRRVLPHLKQAGLTVASWGYNYMEDPEGEAKMVLQSLDDGADWYVFDAEGEVERALHDATRRCMEIVRNARPNAILGYAPFPISQYHANYPYRLFDQFCDVNLPQVYWKAIGWTVDTVWRLMVEGFNQLGLQKPIAPIGQAYDDATGDEIRRFAELATDCTGLSWWVWEQATPEQIQAITEVTKPPGSPTSPPKDEGNTIPFTPVPDDVVASLKAENAILKAKIAKALQDLA